MAHPIKILEPAQHELEEIAQLHLALVGPNSARKITDKIYTAIEQAALFPQSGYPIHDRTLRQQGYRCLLAGKYIIFLSHGGRYRLYLSYHPRGNRLPAAVQGAF